MHKLVDSVIVVWPMELDIETCFIEPGCELVLKFRRLAAVVAENLEHDAGIVVLIKDFRSVEQDIYPFEHGDLPEKSDP